MALNATKPLAQELHAWACMQTHKRGAMLFTLLAHARSSVPRMSAETVAEFPSPELSPTDVVTSQIVALQAEDDQRTFRFASPEGKRATGEMKRMSRHYYAPPHHKDNPVYEPVVGCSQFAIVAALLHEDVDRWRRRRCTCRVRVWPASVSGEEQIGDIGGDVVRIPVAAPPIEYHWRLTKQPQVRPACYEDDPMQAGVSSGPPGRGCWMVDEVSRCWDGGDGGGGGRRGGDDTPGGGGVAIVLERCAAEKQPGRGRRYTACSRGLDDSV